MNKENKKLRKFVSVLVIILGIYLISQAIYSLIFRINTLIEIIIIVIQASFGIFSLIWGIYYLKNYKKTLSFKN